MDRTQTPQAQHSPATQPWPQGVTHRYANLVGATVDIRQDTNGYSHATCTGCPYGWTGDDIGVHNRARKHAERCRAVPRPQEA